MLIMNRLFGLQLFADGGAAGDGGGDGGTDGGQAAATVDTQQQTDDAYAKKLRELGVPETKIRKKGKAATTATPATQSPAPAAQSPAATAPAAAAAEPAAQAPAEGAAQPTPQKKSWEELMADPEYNEQMQRTVQARLKAAKCAEENLQKLSPTLELLARRYGLDAEKLDFDALNKKINDDDSYYEDKALDLGVSIEEAKRIDKNERDAARQRREQERTVEEQKLQRHFEGLQTQAIELQKTFPKFNLQEELKNPAFLRMTSPNVNIPIADAYYAIHRQEIQAASMQVAAQKTAQKLAASVQSGAMRPNESGSAQAPSVTTFNYANASKQQREQLKRQIREAAAQGRKLYPGQR